MNARSTGKVVNDLMYLALLDMREEALRINNKTISYLCDLFHNVPSMLDKVEQGEITHDEVLRRIKQKAEDMKIGSWIDHNLAQLDSSN